jgi:hypothetical protein
MVAQIRPFCAVFVLFFYYQFERYRVEFNIMYSFHCKRPPAVQCRPVLLLQVLPASQRRVTHSLARWQDA